LLKYEGQEKKFLKEIAIKRCKVKCSGDINEIKVLDTSLQNLHDVSDS